MFRAELHCSSAPIDFMTDRRMRTILLSALAYASLVGIARLRSWVCACWSRGRAPGSVPADRVVACACRSRGRVPGQVPAGRALDMRSRIFSLHLPPPL
jgi:hypothetical protein